MSSATCEDESLSTPTECRMTRKPRRPMADGTCPDGYEKQEGFLLPTCLPVILPEYTCFKEDPRLCTRPRKFFTTYAPMEVVYPSLPL